jgi:hypothetical protein
VKLILTPLVLLGVGLLAAPYLKAFRYGTQPWKPRGSRLGLWTLVPLASIYVLGNLFVLVFSWWPSDLKKSLRTAAPIVPSVIGPVLGTVFLVAGAFYWVWDLHILRWLGYTTEVMAETHEETELDVRMYFHVSDIRSRMNSKTVRLTFYSAILMGSLFKCTRPWLIY